MYLCMYVFSVVSTHPSNKSALGMYDNQARHMDDTQQGLSSQRGDHKLMSTYARPVLSLVTFSNPMLYQGKLPDTGIPLLCIYPRELKTSTQKILLHIYSNTICNSQKQKQTSLNR